MAAKASTRSAHAAGRNRRVAARGRSKPSVAATRDAALIRKMLLSDCSERRHLLIQDLIYNLSCELCDLAYSSGFDLGAEAYKDSDRTFDALGRLLNNAGMGKTTFRPFEHHGIVTAYGVDSHGARLGVNIHAFEAGLIAGFLSAHARKRIIVREMNCAYNGAGFCQFVASSLLGKVEDHGKAVSLGKLATLVDSSMRSRASLGTSKPYYALLTRPLLNEPMLSNASKLMYLIGKKIAESVPRNPREFERGVARMASYLGIERAKVTSGRGRSRAIDLYYDHYCSTSGFVDLTTAMLAGFSKGVFNKNVYVQKRLSGRGNYSVRMSLMPAAAMRGGVRP